MTKEVFPGTCRDHRRGERLADEFGAWHKRRYNAFTLIELVLVVGIITVLAGLVLSTVGYARKKSARARAETEIAAIAAACENYKADNGIYPRDNATNQYTDALDARQNFDPTGKSYLAFKPNMLLPAGGSGTVTAISDPFGNSYGYSTANQADSSKGYN